MKRFPFVLLVCLMAATPALAQKQTIQVSASFSAQVLASSDNEALLATQERTLKRSMYERAARECDDLRATIALACAITNMNVSAQINRSYGQPPTLYVNSSVTMQVTLKQP